jgi:LytS/YehU family sensor histidine kinase
MLVYKALYPFYLLLINTLAYALFHAVSFYVSAYWLFPLFFRRRKYVWLVLSLLATVIASSLLLALALYSNVENHAPQFKSFTYLQAFSMAFFSTLTMAGMLLAIKIVRDRIGEDKQLRKFEQQRLETELQYLKAQVNPHFLFNAINSIYFLIKKNPDQAAETLIKLSDLLRFQLYDCSDEKIPIEKELEYIENYMSLEQLRKGNRVTVEYVKEGNLSGFLIAPFLLIPFLENAFKYISNYPDLENLIRVKLVRDGERFTASFFNTHEDLIRNEVGGIGLKNVSRRLELLYPKQYDLRIKGTSETFTVTLSLDLA